MSAVMREGVKGREWPHDRLVEWANWARCPLPGAEGTSEGYLRERTDQAHPGEPTAEIVITEKAVGKMYVERPHYTKAFNMYYLTPTEVSEYEISLRLFQPIERITAILRQARILVGHHIYNIERALTFGGESVKFKYLSALSRAKET
jgi:hypothetical protein